MPDRGDRLRIVAPSASPAQAAAVVAALERFLRDTAPALASAPPPESRWVRTARAEAVDREPRREVP